MSIYVEMSICRRSVGRSVGRSVVGRSSVGRRSVVGRSVVVGGRGRGRGRGRSWSVVGAVVGAVVVVVNFCGFVRLSGLWYDFSRWRWSPSDWSL